MADFKSQKSLDLTLKKTLKNIKNSLNGSPTVLWSGNGYHVIQPLECPIELEHITEFQKYKNITPLLSQEFLRFAKYFLSNGKADKNNYPSFNSCLLRIPGSINSKCLDNIEKRLSGNIKVKVLQKWNRDRVLISREFIEDFRTYLEQKITDQENNNRNDKNNNQNKYNNNNNNNDNTSNCYYEWIEKLLQTPIEDGRKFVLWRIFCPYLINVRKLSPNDSTLILREWLNKCNSVRKLDFDHTHEIKERLKHVGNFKPIGIQKLKTDGEYRELYQLIFSNKSFKRKKVNRIIV